MLRNRRAVRALHPVDPDGYTPSHPLSFVRSLKRSICAKPSRSSTSTLLTKEGRGEATYFFGSVGVPARGGTALPGLSPSSVSLDPSSSSRAPSFFDGAIPFSSVAFAFGAPRCMYSLRVAQRTGQRLENLTLFPWSRPVQVRGGERLRGVHDRGGAARGVPNVEKPNRK